MRCCLCLHPSKPDDKVEIMPDGKAKCVNGVKCLQRRAEHRTRIEKLPV